MSYTQTFVVEGELLGTTMRAAMQGVRGPVPPSFSFFCYGCGEVWAKCAVSEGLVVSPFMAVTVSCRTCNDTSRSSGAPGTLYLPLQPEFNASFPDDVVRWEFDRNLESLSHIEGIME